MRERSERARSYTSRAPAYPFRHFGAGRNPFLSVSACETLSDERDTEVWMTSFAVENASGVRRDDDAGKAAEITKS